MNVPTPPDVEPFDAVYVDAAARILGVLSHPTRLHLVLLVAQGETHVTRLAELLGVSQSNVSHHLSLLRNLGLVSDRREGQFVLYRVNVPAWQLLAHGFFEHLVEGSDELRLQDFVIRRSQGPATAEEAPCDPTPGSPRAEDIRARTPAAREPDRAPAGSSKTGEAPGKGKKARSSKKGKKGQKKGKAAPRKRENDERG